MRILYVAEARLPGLKADGIHVMRMCRSLVNAGHTVKLMAFRDASFENVEHCFDYYGVEPVFDIELVNAPGSGRLASLWLAVRAFLGIVRKKPDMAYTRSVTSAFFMSRLTRDVILELHTFQFQAAHGYQRFFFRWMIEKKTLRGIVVISDALKKLYMDGGIEPDNLFVAHDGSDIMPRHEEEELKGDYVVNVGYFGSVYKGRGIERIIDMAQARSDVGFHIFGANLEDMNGYGSIPGNMHFYGFISPSLVYKYRNACDILVAPYQKEVYVSSKQSYSTSSFMSPLKIFEYMSAGKAMIVSDMPVLREVLSDRTAVLVPPGEAEPWINALDTLKEDRSLREQLGQSALTSFLSNYTWDKRAVDITKWCKPRLAK